MAIASSYPREISTSDVRFSGVEKHYGSSIALHRLDLVIPRGSFFSLLGPSGCGKTTSLRLIAGFEQPTRGDVFIGEKQVTNLPAYKRNFGMVFQNYALFPHLSVEENVRFGLQMRRIQGAEARKRVADALDIVALGSLRDRFPRQLSGGQQQRVALARAIVFEPDVLLLDEPLGALDKMLRDQMQLEIRQLQKRLGTTTVFVTHDQEEALTMSDFVSVMRDGRLQQTGSPSEIYERPKNEFVATFLGASNIIEGIVKGYRGTVLDVECLGSVFSVPSSHREAATRLKLALRPEKVRLDEQGGVRGCIKSIVYRGAHTQVTIECAGNEITALVTSSSLLGDLSPGAETCLSWSTDALVVLD